MSQSNYLSEAELEAYQADGFLIRESVYDPQQLEAKPTFWIRSGLSILGFSRCSLNTNPKPSWCES